MEELSRLGNFVRLADYLLVTGVTRQALAAAEETLALLTSGRAAVRPLFVLRRLVCCICGCSGGDWGLGGGWSILSRCVLPETLAEERTHDQSTLNPKPQSETPI